MITSFFLLFGGVLHAKSGDSDCPLSVSLQWHPEMLLVSLSPHYDLLCVLHEWLVMIMQMCHRRVAWVIITAENEAFWNSLTAEMKTVCMCLCPYQCGQALGLCYSGHGDTFQTCSGLSEAYALWVVYPAHVQSMCWGTQMMSFFNNVLLLLSRRTTCVVSLTNANAVFRFYCLFNSRWSEVLFACVSGCNGHLLLPGLAQHGDGHIESISIHLDTNEGR